MALTAAQAPPWSCSVQTNSAPARSWGLARLPLPSTRTLPTCPPNMGPSQELWEEKGGTGRPAGTRYFSIFRRNPWPHGAAHCPAMSVRPSAQVQGLTCPCPSPRRLPPPPYPQAALKAEKLRVSCEPSRIFYPRTCALSPASQHSSRARRGSCVRPTPGTASARARRGCRNERVTSHRMLPLGARPACEPCLTQRLAG